MQLIDLTNQKFNRLTVLKRGMNLGTKQSVSWVCLCDCGVIKEIEGQSLKRGKTRSCGCYKKEQGSWNKGVRNSASHSYKGYKDISLEYFNNLKYKAKKRDLSFEITIEFLQELLEKQKYKCAITNINLNSFENASVDRIDSKIGYLFDNIQWVDRRINFMKGPLTQKDFIELCRKVTEANELV